MVENTRGCLWSHPAEPPSSKIHGISSDIIRSSHLTFYPFMFFRLSEVKRTLPGLAVCVCTVFWLLSCSGSGTNGSHPSGLPLRAFVSNPVSPTAIGHGPVLDIVNASRDLLSGFVVNLASLSASVADAGMMALSPKR